MDKQLSQTSDILNQGFSTAGLRLSKWVVADFVQVVMGAGATFDWTFFDNSKLIDFDC